METLVLTFHVLLATVLIVAILLQAGKGADIGAVFGGGGSQTLFGSRGPATFLNKLTIVMAVLFLVTSLSLAQFAKQKSKASVIDKANLEGAALPAQEPAEKPAAPETKTPEKKK